MKKIINDPARFVEEFLDGLCRAYPGQIRSLPDDPRVIVRAVPKEEGKVAIVTAGGSGHLPVFLGYVGRGMIDACSVGNVFASPSAESMFNAIRAVDTGAGVLCLYGNYGGDKMNFAMAQEMADFEDITVREIRVCDDIASSPEETKENRRGVAGLVYAYKIAGAAAEEGRSLDEVIAVTNRALASIRTMGVATSPCIVPEVGRSTFQIEDDMIEVGMGIHGEPGISVQKMMTADEIAELVTAKILTEITLAEGDEVSVMVNGLGATPLEELMIVFRRVHQLLSDMGVTVVLPHVGEYATSMEMAGCSVTIFKLDEETKALLTAPGATPFYTNLNLL